MSLENSFPFWVALILTVVSLLFYLGTAFLHRGNSESEEEKRFVFNLGVPEMGNFENLFAIALISAGTSLSTVFVFFLTAGSLFGWWLLICPIMFGIGNYVLYITYLRIDKFGFFKSSTKSQSTLTGLVPYIGQLLTGNVTVGKLLAVLSLINLFAILVLELVVGVEIFSYLVGNITGNHYSKTVEFFIFFTSIFMLLAYVFVGGFKAVLSSDVWQMKAMRWAIFLSIISLAVFLLSSEHKISEVASIGKNPPFIILGGFILNVILANLFAPLSQEASWQRFRAFSLKDGINIKDAMARSIGGAIVLWGALILLAYLLMLSLLGREGLPLSSMSNVLESIRNINDWWFPFFVFPILTVASLSAMFSTADTTISALLYLLEYSLFSKNKSKDISRNGKLPKNYYFAGFIIILASIGVYLFVRVWFSPTILQLVFSVFSNLVVIAPTIICAAFVGPSSGSDKLRTTCIISSLIVGFTSYWACSITAMVVGESFLWLSQLSILFGLVGAILPVLPLFAWSNKKQEPAAGGGK